MQEFKETEPTPSSPLPEEVSQLERHEAVDAKEVRMEEIDLSKKKRVLTKSQKKNLRLRQAIAWKNREDQAKAKLDEPYAGQVTKEEEKTESEPAVKEEDTKKEPVQRKKRLLKKTWPTSPYSTPEESEKSEETESGLDEKSEDSKSSLDDYTLSSSEESKEWRTPPSKKNRTWEHVMTMPLSISTNVKKNIIAPLHKTVKFI